MARSKMTSRAPVLTSCTVVRAHVALLAHTQIPVDWASDSEPWYTACQEFFGLQNRLQIDRKDYGENLYYQFQKAANGPPTQYKDLPNREGWQAAALVIAVKTED